MQRKKLEIRPEALKSFKNKLEDILINDIKIGNLPEVVPINPDDEISSSEYIDPPLSLFEDNKDAPIDHIPYIVSDNFDNKLDEHSETVSDNSNDGTSSSEYIDPSPSLFEDNKDTPVNQIPYILSNDFYNKLLDVGNTFDRETQQQLENILGQGNLSYLLSEIINNYLDNQYKIVEKQLSQLKPQILPDHDAPQAELKRLVNLTIPKIVEESEEIKAKRKELYRQINLTPCAEILINVLLDLPQEYNVNIGLSSQNVDFNDILIEGEISIGIIHNPNVTILESKNSFNNFFKGFAYFITRSVDSYDDSHHVVFKIILDGYIINDKHDAPIYIKLVKTIKALIGIGLIRGMFYIKFANGNDTNISIMEKKLLSSFIFHKNLKVSNVNDEFISYPYPLHPDTSRLITLLDISNNLSMDNIENTLKLIAKILNSDENDENAQKIRIAAEWYFDSLANSSNELLAYIQAITALEILLGDKDEEISLTNLLANRCAYLICNSAEERERLLGEFKIIYDLRSRIVHSGTSKISEKSINKRKQSIEDYDFYKNFNKLRDILKRVLAKEIELYIQSK